jgi:adenylosuccinate lyase
MPIRAREGSRSRRSPQRSPEPGVPSRSSPTLWGARSWWVVYLRSMGLTKSSGAIRIVVLCSALIAGFGCGDESAATSAGGGGSSSSTTTSAGSGGEGGAGGAGGAPDTDDTFESGSRLRAIVVDGGGDARRFEGWFDSELGVECEMRRQPGDEWRCLPNGSAEIGYLDAACTQPVAVPYGTCPWNDTYITTWVPANTACNADDSAHDVVYRVLGDAGALPAYHRLGPNGCAPASIPTKPAKLLELVPIESFVELERSLVPVDEALGRWTYSSDDGASVVQGMHDLARDGRCNLMDPPPADGARVCVPSSHRRYPGWAYWADDSCGVPVVTLNACSDLTLPIIDFVFTGSCGETYGVMREAGAVHPPPLHETFGQNPQCVLQNGLSGLEAGAEIPLDGFPTLDEAVRSGGELELVRPSPGSTSSSPPARRWSALGDRARRGPGAAAIAPSTGSSSRPLDAERIDEIERTTKHDVIAFLTHVEELAGEPARWLHLRHDVVDVLDTRSRSCRPGRALDADRAQRAHSRRAREARREHARTPMIGRSHGIHAEPITASASCSPGWYAETAARRARLRAAREAIAVGKIAGAVGTYAQLSIPRSRRPRWRARPRGPRRSPRRSSRAIATPRSSARSRSSAPGSSSSRPGPPLAAHRGRRGRGGFTAGQKGSSAMPHKRNPILSENLCRPRAHRLLRSYAQALEDVALWHERDISHSSVERMPCPTRRSSLAFMLDARHAASSSTSSSTPSACARTSSARRLYFSEAVMLALVQTGLPAAGRRTCSCSARSRARARPRRRHRRSCARCALNRPRPRSAPRVCAACALPADVG